MPGTRSLGESPHLDWTAEPATTTPQPPPHTSQFHPEHPEIGQNPPNPLTRELNTPQHAKTPLWDVRHHP